ncbi:hypothetical protein [Streptomyces sp. Ru87]|uniref:hypothetical protein n=1 Tax=Streptomyces sp. Ru87 TaxID=2044307 RepID=UPI0015D51B80|nr:hypothetical protein [Streptomyces sp. Ru87]
METIVVRVRRSLFAVPRDERGVETESRRGEHARRHRAWLRRARGPLSLVVLAALVTACGSASSPDTPSSPTRSTAPPSSSPAPDAGTSSEPPATSELTRDAQDAFKAAKAEHPGADLDQCTLTTPLDDTACGKAITAADQVASDTARRLREREPEHADLLYGAVLSAAAGFRDTLGPLRDTIPCYGLSDEPQPPPPLRAEAESICAEGADIAKTAWGIFLSQVEP